MSPNETTRRTVLVGTSIAGASALAGCLGNGNGNGDDDGEDFERPDDWPDDLAFTPNPEIEGPGGDVTLAMQFTVNNTPTAEEFNTFEVDFEAVEFHDVDGGTVEIPVERVIDFYDFELRTTLTLVFDMAIPAGTYTHVEFDMDAIEIVHGDDGDVTEHFTQPPIAEFSADGGAEMLASVSS